VNTSGIVIVGGGQGGYQVAASLRDDGYADRVTLIGQEPRLPYQRPPLSKAYLTGEADEEQLQLRPASFYESRNISLLTSQRATRIDRVHRRIQLASGATLDYAHLVLATGATPRRLKLPGADLDGVLVLRGIDDADQIRERLQHARAIVIIGAGFIGLELAAVASTMGTKVNVIEVSDRSMKRSVSILTADFLTKARANAGAQFHFGTAIREITGSKGRVNSVLLTNGQRLDADIAVIGIGVEPEVGLAKEAGLPITNGIVVDSHLLTEDPAISAIGDCACFPCDFSTRPLRLESVQNAVDQARCVAARLVGKTAPYRKVPWFWSDQGQFKLQIAGVAEEEDAAVTRGDPSTGRFSVFRLRAGRLTAAESVNQPADHLVARKLLERGAQLNAQQVANISLKLGELVT